MNDGGIVTPNPIKRVRRDYRDRLKTVLSLIGGCSVY
jgi:hypothetical protein